MTVRIPSLPGRQLKNARDMNEVRRWGADADEWFRQASITLQELDQQGEGLTNQSSPVVSLTAHASTHASGGSDPITHSTLAGLTTGNAGHTQFLRHDGSVALTADWDAGSFEVRAQTFESDVATGTAPLVVASTTLVTNLNADLLDGLDESQFLRSDANDTGSATLTLSSAAPLIISNDAPILEFGATDASSTIIFRGRNSISSLFRFERQGGATLSYTCLVGGITQASSGTFTVTAAGNMAYSTSGTGAIAFSAAAVTGVGVAFNSGAGSQIVLNNSAVDVDTIIKGDTDVDLIHVDASTDRVGISTATPDTLFHVDGAAHVGGDLKIDGDVNIIAADNDRVLFGAGSDAAIYYNGTNLVLDPRLVGVGGVMVVGGGNFLLGRSNAGAFTTRSGSSQATLGTHYEFRDANDVALLTIDTSGVSGVVTELDYTGVIHLNPTGTEVRLCKAGAQTSVMGDLQISEDLNHDGTLIGFFGVAPAARPAAYTQTYSTATRTHAAFTSADLSVVMTNIAPYGFTTQAQADSLQTEFNALRADVANIKQLVNQMIDDFQLRGDFQ